MCRQSKYDLIPEYRTKLVDLINDALDVYRQYEYLIVLENILQYGIIAVAVP